MGSILHLHSSNLVAKQRKSQEWSYRRLSSRRLGVFFLCETQCQKNNFLNTTKQSFSTVKAAVSAVVISVKLAIPPPAAL